MNLQAKKNMPSGKISIPLRLFIPMLLLCASILALVFLYWDSASKNQLNVERESRQDMEVLGAHLQDDLEYFLRENDIEVVQAKFSELSAMPDIKFAVLTDEHGKIIAATWLPKMAGKLAGQLAGTPYERDLERLQQAARASKEGESVVASDRRAILALFPVRIDTRGDRLRPEKSGSLFLLQDISFRLEVGRAENAEWLIKTALLLGALMLVIGLILHFLVSRRIVRLESAAQRVSAGDMRVIENLGRMDEIGRLGNSFNAMVRSLVTSS